MGIYRVSTDFGPYEGVRVSIVALPGIEENHEGHKEHEDRLDQKRPRLPLSLSVSITALPARCGFVAFVFLVFLVAQPFIGRPAATSLSRTPLTVGESAPAKPRPPMTGQIAASRISSGVVQASSLGYSHCFDVTRRPSQQHLTPQGFTRQAGCLHHKTTTPQSLIAATNRVRSGIKPAGPIEL